MAIELGHHCGERAFVLDGRFDARFLGDYYRTVDALLTGGHSVHERVQPIGHSPHAWKHEIPAFLLHFGHRMPSVGTQPAR